MKKIFSLAFLLVCMSIQMFAQGIAFQKVTLENALATAKAQNKLVFIDFYTDWCGPCKNLAKNVFPNAEVGEYYNKHFICLKLNAEKEGATAARKYQVSAYPTLIFLNGEGKSMLKRTGGGGVESILQLGKDAAKSLNDPDNLLNMKKRYAAEKNNEDFMKKYVTVLEKSGGSYRDELEHFLSIQKSIPVQSSKMFELLLHYQNTLLVGGSAERILKENLSEYLEIATESEAKDLRGLHARMLRNTRELAEKRHDAKLFEKFFTVWKENKEEHRGFESEGAYELDLLYFQGNDQDYRIKTLAYLDGMMEEYPVDQVKENDKKHYEDYCKKNNAGGSMAELFRKANKDLTAGINTRHLLKAASRMLRLAKKGDFKHYEKWLEYAKQLQPNDIMVDNLRSNVLYKKGKKKEAIALKKQLIEKDGPQGRYVQHLKAELKRMEDGSMFGKKK